MSCRRPSLLAPLGLLICLAAAAFWVCRASRRDVRDIYGMLREYE